MCGICFLYVFLPLHFIILTDISTGKRKPYIYGKMSILLLKNGKFTIGQLSSSRLKQK